jgi:hypothetical protein
MAMPYMYRDYPLYLFMLAVVVMVGLVKGTEGRRSIEITVARVCPSNTACPLAASLAEWTASEDVRQESRHGIGVVSFQVDHSLSAQQIWNAVEGTSCRPLRMIVDNREFITKSVP